MQRDEARDPDALAGVRILIDGVDTAMLVGLALRRRLTAAAWRIKQAAARPLGDGAREAQVQRRARMLGAVLGLPAESALALSRLLIADARRLQGLEDDLSQGGPGPVPAMLAATRAPLPAPARLSMPTATSRVFSPTLLKWLPPPSRLAVPLRLLPYGPQRRMLEAGMARALAAPLAEGALDFLDGRRIGIEVSDLGLRWVVGLHEGRLRALAHGSEAEATVRGSATDLLLLAARLEDADTLFFQRRLVLTGDTELGLTARNLLDRLPWEQVPLPLRIALNRAARLARRARAAHRGDV